MTEPLRFTPEEFLSLFGVAQCLLILVDVTLRSRGLFRRAILTLCYFSILGGAFLSDFASRFLSEAFPNYDVLRWLLWTASPPLSVLLIRQIMTVGEPLPARTLLILLTLPIAALLGYAGNALALTTDFLTPYTLSGVICSGLALLTLWTHRSGIADVRGQVKTAGMDRYWLILALLSANILLLGMMLSNTGDWTYAYNARLIRTILGIGFVYLATTSLFRIYPQALKLAPLPASLRPAADTLSGSDRELAGRITELLDLQKVYHEPAYSRGDLARELDVPEATLSKVVNAHFGKSVPQLLNERRVGDAQRLLKETTAPIRQIASESGFNSVASFNRVFRDLTGMSPSEFRGDGQAADDEGNIRKQKAS